MNLVADEQVKFKQTDITNQRHDSLSRYCNCLGPAMKI